MSPPRLGLWVGLRAPRRARVTGSPLAGSPVAAPRASARRASSSAAHEQVGVTPRWSSAPAGLARVAYITDAEGNLDFVAASLERSDTVRWDALRCELELCGPDTGLVFGGDCVDRGAGDMRLARALVSLKRRHPERVFLLAGNRDVNKIRLSSELEGAAPAALRAILERTMGAPDAFEFRRAELRTTGCDASDEAVLASFRDGVKAGGYMREYLEHAQLAVRVRDSLFVHGALPRGGLGFVPARSGPAEREHLREHAHEHPHEHPHEHQHPASPCTELGPWLEQLNAFYWDEVRAWAVGEPGAARVLLEYARPGKLASRGVIYNDWLAAGATLPQPVPPDVAAFLHRAGVRRVLSGHRPHGDTPTVIAAGAGHDRLYVVTADTSYSERQSASNTRAPCELTLLLPTAGGQNERESQCVVRGARADGTVYRFVVEEHLAAGLGRSWRSPDGREGWLKAALPGHAFLACFPRGAGSFSSELDYALVPFGTNPVR
jgi:hypothetical protein